MPSNHSNFSILRLIAIFKFSKAALLFVVGVGVLKLVHNGGGDALEEWISTLALKPGAHYLEEAVSKLASIPPNRLKEVGFGSFVYAALFLTEGIGLWLRKPWAEWFTVIMTASLIPLEIYEIFHHPTVSKVVVLVLHIRKERSGAR